MPYADADDVRRVQPRAISASSEPTEAEVTTEIDRVETFLNQHLAAHGITSPVTDANGVKILESIVARKVGAFVLHSKRAVTDEENTTTNEPEALLVEWDKLIADIEEKPSYVAKLLGHPFSSANRGNFRSHVKDNSLGKTIADGDFDPVFRKDDEL